MEQQQVSEEQLMQMAQQEEANLQNKHSMLSQLSSALKETVIARDALIEIKNTKGKVLVNLGATVLIEAEIKNVEKCKRGMSENAYKEESIEDTLKWLAEKEELLQKQITRMNQEYSTSEQRLTSLVGLLKQIEANKEKQISSLKRTVENTK